MNNKKIALINVNEIQITLNAVKRTTKKNKKKLEKEGWEIKFAEKIPVNLTKKENKKPKTFCKATKEVENDKKIVIEKKAECAENDVYIEELGEYLALARVYSAIKEA